MIRRITIHSASTLCTRALSEVTDDRLSFRDFFLFSRCARGAPVIARNWNWEVP